jgi:hypothetical protein
VDASQPLGPFTLELKHRIDWFDDHYWRLEHGDSQPFVAFTLDFKSFKHRSLNGDGQGLYRRLNGDGPCLHRGEPHGPP